MDEISPSIGNDPVRVFWIVQCPDKTSTTYIVTDISLFCKKHKLNKSHLLSVARGDRKHHKQYVAQEFQCKLGIIPTTSQASMYNRYVDTTIKF